MAKNSIIIGVRTDTRKAIQGFRDLNKATKNNLSATRRWAYGLRSASYVAIGALAGVAIAAKRSLQDASDLQEATSKSHELWGAQHKDIMRWAREEAIAHGYSTQAALDATSGYAQYLAMAGLAGQARVDTAIDLAKLAADLASFGNYDIDRVAAAIKSAFAGEYEPLKGVDIVGINDTALKEWAKENLDWSGTVLDPETRAKALLGAIEDGLKDPNNILNKADGDFLRTSGGLANATRILQAMIESISAALGVVLLPAVTEVVKGLQWLADWVLKNQQAAKIAIVSFIGLTAVLAALNPIVRLVTGAVLVLRGAIFVLNAVIKANPLVRVIALFVALGTVLVTISGVTAAASGETKKLKEWYDEKLKPAIDNVITIVKALARAFKWAWDKYIGPVMLGFIIPATETVFAAIDAIAKLVKGDFSGAWDAAKTAGTNFFKMIGNFLISIPKLILSMIKDLVSSFDTMAASILQAMKNGLAAFPAWLLQKVKDVIPSIASSIKSGIMSAIRGAVGLGKTVGPNYKNPLAPKSRLAAPRSQKVQLDVTGQQNYSRAMTEEAVAQALYRILRRSDARHGELWAA